MVRIFVGIFLPDNLKSSVVETQKRIEKLPIECKLVEEKNLHVSLDFIGDVEENELEEIKNKISDLAKSFKPFQVEIGDLKLIPSERFVRVIAFGINSIELSSLGEEIQKKIGGDAKPPHLTLCRVKKVLSKNELLDDFSIIEKEKIGSFKVSSIQLIKSELRREGPVYSVVSDFSFA
jgi:RNA 2',3'-cyclic 3'-phosphodiesterase